ncbi:MAG: restriction endonuclease subunit S [Bacteroidales bacterium]|nr:restriction endonuclease subunit S [Bacteroidales bacterium]
MKKINNTPTLRFPGFEGEWEMKKLGAISLKVGSGSTPLGGQKAYVSNGVIFIRSQNVNENRLNLNDIVCISENTHNKMSGSVVKADDILLNITGASLGRSCVVPDDFITGNVNQHVCIIRLDQHNSPRFIQPLISSSKGQKLMVEGQTGSGREGLNFQSIRGFKLSLPTLPEQQKIAAFLKAVDSKLSQLKKKLSLLEQYKKGVMQQIFSQQIRFRQDDGSEFPEWEEKKLGEVAKFRRGSFPQPYGLPEWYDDEFGMPFIQVYDVDENMLLKPTTKNKISEMGAKQSVFVKKGTLVITIQGSIGRIAKTQYDAYVDRTLLIFQTYKLPIDVDYFKFVVFLLFEIEKTKAPGGTIKTITKEVLTDFTVPIPSIIEQTKIATFLSAIDDKINHCSKQIEKMELWKKGLLQQMFC